MKQQSVPILVVPLVTIIFTVVAAAGAALFMSTRSAYAEIEGPCSATIAGVDVAGVNSGNRDDDIHVSQDQAVAVGAISPVGFESHKVELEFGSRRWTVSEEDDDGSQAWSGTVNVDDYATWGVGLYKVIGVSTLTDGTRCEGAATVDVDGNPLATVAGGIAAGAAVLGTLGGLATATVAATRNPGPLSEFGPLGEMTAEAWREDEARREEAAPERPLSSREEARQNLLDWLWNPFIDIAGCLCFAAIALLLMPLMALTGGAGGGESGTPGEPATPATGGEEPRRLPRAPWRPRITLLGLVGGLLAGAGGVVLLQQYSIDYPTLGVIIRTVLIGMAVYGIVLPTLGYTIGWLRVNGRLARLEREIGRR